VVVAVSVSGSKVDPDTDSDFTFAATESTHALPKSDPLVPRGPLNRLELPPQAYYVHKSNAAFPEARLVSRVATEAVCVRAASVGATTDLQRRLEQEHQVEGE